MIQAAADQLGAISWLNSSRRFDFESGYVSMQTDFTSV